MLAIFNFTFTEDIHIHRHKFPYLGLHGLTLAFIAFKRLPAQSVSTEVTLHRPLMERHHSSAMPQAIKSFTKVKLVKIFMVQDLTS